MGIWALSGLILLWSTIWLNSLEKKTKENFFPSVNNLTGIASSSLSDVNKQVKPADDTLRVVSSSPVIKESINSFAVSTSSIAEQEKQENLVTFEFISPNSEKRFQIAIMENETVYQAMLRLKEKSGLVFEVKDYSGLGVFVESINGLTNNPKENQFWIYYLNNKTAITGVSLTKLHFNDLITWRYENRKF